MHRKNGFTLIELLVVIAIIAILAAILFPVFMQVKDKARQSACFSNMKQIGVGTMQYLSDYNETYPFFRMGDGWNSPGKWQSTWSYILQRYISTAKVFQCPSGANNPAGPMFPVSWNLGIRHDYLTPAYGWPHNPKGLYLFGCLDWYGNPPWPAAKTSEVRTPSRVVMVYETMPGYYPGYCYGWFWPTYYARGIHNGGCNFAFGDGHARWYRTDGMREGDLSTGPAPNAGPTDWKSAKISMRKNYSP